MYIFQLTTLNYECSYIHDKEAIDRQGGMLLEYQTISHHNQLK